MMYEIITLVIAVLTIVSEVLPFCRNVASNGIIHYLFQKVRTIKKTDSPTPHEGHV